jgi:Polyketide cyclase / dehydrase and lipid transport
MYAIHEQALLDAPLSTVWGLVSSPRRYPEWFPRVLEVEGERFDEGAEFVQVSEMPLGGHGEVHFLIDRKDDDLRELRMHCTISGMFIHWQLTDAQGGTFLDAEFGIDPIRRRDRLTELAGGRRFLRRWLMEAVAGLKQAATVRPGV